MLDQQKVVHAQAIHGIRPALVCTKVCLDVGYIELSGIHGTQDQLKSHAMIINQLPAEE